MTKKLKKSRKGKKRSMVKVAEKQLIGLQLVWDVEDPLAPDYDISNPGIKHKNPILALMIDNMRPNIMPVIDTREFLWHLDIECEFKNELETYMKGAVVVLRGVLKDHDGHFDEAIEKIFSENNMSHYIVTHVKATILGTRSINESDFGEDCISVKSA
jgi:hypothetical protein